MTAMQAMLAGLIDYAGLYPPASLDMRSAVQNYRDYRGGKHRNALGRFVVDLRRSDELIASAGSLVDLKLSLILAHPSQADELQKLLDAGAQIESVECKAASSRDIEQLGRRLPSGMEAYIEIPIEPVQSDLLQAIANAGAGVKLRMGGIVAEAFPTPAAVVRMVAALVSSGAAFKATAGLHHPIRSVHPFTYAQGSAAGLMHGFVNLFCAAALIQSGADVAEAESVLQEQDAAAWSLTGQTFGWRSHVWSLDLLSRTRKTFVSFGSCSFEEPMRDLEELGWL
jgi:hypothetical protein